MAKKPKRMLKQLSMVARDLNRYPIYPSSYMNRLRTIRFAMAIRQDRHDGFTMAVFIAIDAMAINIKIYRYKGTPLLKMSFLKMSQNGANSS